MKLKFQNFRLTSANHFVPILAFSLGFFWLIFIYSSGLQFSADSGHYLGYALDMHYDGNYFVHAQRPPLYPFLINLFMYFDGFPAGAAALVSGISMILLLVVFALILQKFSKDIFLNSLFLIVFFIFDKFLYVFKFAWSEVPFSLFLILNFYFVIRHHETKKIKHYVFSAIFVSLAALTRYMGYSLIAAFFIYTLYFLYINRRSKNISAKKYLLLNTISYLPIILFLIRNYLFLKTFHGPRTSAHLTVFQNCIEVFKVLGENLCSYLLMLLIMSIVFYILFKKKDIKPGENKTTFSLSYILLIAAIYIGMMVYSTSSVRLDPISIRYFSPIYAFFFLFVFIIYSLVVHSPMWADKKPAGNFIKIFFYCIVFAILIGHSRGFFIFMDNIYKNRYVTDCNPMSAGYETSPAMKKMNAHFTDIITRQDKLYIVAVHEHINRATYPHLARTHLFRRGLIKASSASGFTFKNINPMGFTINFLLNNKRKLIIYRHLPLTNIGRTLFKRLMRMMQRQKINSVYLVASAVKNSKAVMIKEISRYLPMKLHVHYREKIGSCFVYHIGFKRRGNSVAVPHDAGPTRKR